MSSKKFNEFGEFLSQDVYLKLSEKDEKSLKRVHELKIFNRLHPMSLLQSSVRYLQKLLFTFSVALYLYIYISKYLYTDTNNQPEPIYQKIVTRLPEEYRSDLFQLRERWQKKGLSPKEIEYLTYKHLIHIIFGLIQVKIENFSLFRYSSNKDN